MSTVVKDLGPVTAYAYAVAGGYTGTEEEFTELLGDLAATVADLESLTVTVTTLTPGSSATASYEDGVLALGIPQGAKGDTGTAATIAVGTVTTVAPTQNASVTNTGSSSAAVFAFSIPRGDGVATVTKTGTSGNVDTYTMTSDRGVTLGTFTVTNGNVSSVNGKTGAVVLDAGDLGYDASETYTGGTVGAAVSDLKSAINKVEAGFPQKSASGSVVTIEDGADNVPVVRLTAEINPVQDLHGYDNPWPAGGGKNLLDASTVFGGEPTIYTVNSDGSVTVLSADSRAWTSCPTLNLPAGSYIISKTPTTGTSDIRLSSEEYGTAHIFTSQVTFTLSEAGSVKIKLAYSGQSYPSTQKVQIESGSTATTWTPYSNECPISGWTELNLWQTGKNIYDDTRFELDGNYAELQGIHTPSTADSTKKQNGIYLKAGQTYRLYIDIGTAKQFGVYATRTGSTSSITISGNSSRKTYNATFTPTYEGYYCFWLFSSGGWSAYSKSDFTVQIYVGDEAYSETYPCTGRSISINIGQTVYGGTVTVANGQASAVSKYGYHVLTESDVALAPEAATYTNMTPVTIRNLPNLLVSFYKWGLSEAAGEAITAYPFDSAGNIGKLIRNAGNSVFWVGFPYGTTIEQAKAALVGTGIAYELSSPVEIDLDPVQIKTLYGLNNIWADTGDISLVYRAGLATYTAEQIQTMLNAMVAPVEATTTASKAYSVNDFLILDNVLYKVDAPIANGGTITIGTNVHATTVGEQLTAILNS